MYYVGENPNFGMSVLGCIEADFCNEFNFQLVSRSTRFAHLCIAPDSKNSVSCVIRKLSVNLPDFLRKFAEILHSQIRQSAIFRRDFCENCGKSQITSGNQCVLQNLRSEKIRHVEKNCTEKGK